MNASLEFLDWWHGGAPAGAYGLSWQYPGQAFGAGETYGTVAEMADAAAVHDAAGTQSVWFRVCPLIRPLGDGEGRGKEADTLSMPGLWADLDLDDADAHKRPTCAGGAACVHLNLRGQRNHANAPSLPNPPDVDAAMGIVRAALPGMNDPLIVHTGYGLGAFWKFEQPIIIDRSPTAVGPASPASVKQSIVGFGAALREAARQQGYHIDPVFELARVMRLPGTHNRKVSGQERPARVLAGDSALFDADKLLTVASDTLAAAMLREMPQWADDTGQTRAVGAYTRSRDGNEGHDGLWTREHAAAEVERWLDKVRTTPERSGSTQQLNDSALRLGHFVPDYFDYYEARAALEQAVLCVYPAVDHVGRTQIRSGLAKGMSEPYRVVPQYPTSAGLRGDAIMAPAVTPPVPMLGQPGDRPAAAGATAPAPPPGAVGEVEPTGWTAVDVTQVVAGGDRQRMLPTWGRRTDGVAIIYPGKEHAIASEPECGKTWLAALIVADVLMRGGRVVYVDFEDDEWTIVGERLMAPGVGVQPERLLPEAGQFRYVRPEKPPAPGELEALLTFPTGAADLLVLDGVTEGIQLLGLDYGRYTETAAEWRKIMVKPALRLGTATLATDHVVKDKENRGRFAIGGQHKLAGLNGAMFLMEQDQPFGRGLKGRSRVLISKDRNGGLRQHGKAADKSGLTHFGDLVGDATTDEMASLALFPPATDVEREDGMTAGDIEQARKSLAHLRNASPRELGATELESLVGGRKGRGPAIREWLAQRGAIVITNTSRGVKMQFAKEVESWD